MQVLAKIQSELKAPKGQFNSFGKYNYRSCEDIVEAVKPILHAHNASLLISDEIVAIGDRVYVKATATISFTKDEEISVSAFAREPLTKKGMDEAQITGATSSYARKYALNGLFAIDDTKDADTQEPPKPELITQKIVDYFVAGMESDKDETEVAPQLKQKFSELNNDQQMELNEKLKSVKIQSANNRQGNTVLRAFLDFKLEEVA